MFDFNYYSPTEVEFGKNSLTKLVELIKKYGGSNVLLHYGSGSVIKSGLLDKVKTMLDTVEIPYVELGGVKPNPRLSLVYEGINLCRENNINFILAIGGGSVIDSAKAIGYGVNDGDDVWDLYEHKRKAIDIVPVGVVLTISAAGSETSNSSVITNEETNAKRSYNDNLGRPKFAIMDPNLTMSLPWYQTACGIADILMHTEERYFTSGGNMDITDSIAEGLMRNVIRNGLILKTNPNDYDARAEIMWAGSLSHNGLTGCGNDGGDFSTHMLEHEMGGLYDVAHGAGLAAIWGSWARYVYKDALARFKKFALNVCLVEDKGSDEEIAIKGIEFMEDFYRKIDMPTSMKELGIEPNKEEINLMASNCAKVSGGVKGSAKKLYVEDMIQIYNNANK